MSERPTLGTQNLSEAEGLEIVIANSPEGMDQEIGGWILGNFTGFPYFQMSKHEGETPRETLARQVREFHEHRPDLKEWDSA